MIEFCTRKRMILSILVLGGLTVIILILEASLTADLGPTHVQNSSGSTTTPRRPSEAVEPESSSSDKASRNSSKALPQGSQNKKRICWEIEDFELIQPCLPCSDFELSSKTPVACEETGLKETLRCRTYGVVFRSCTRVAGAERRKFWIFELLMLLSTVFFLFLIRLRHRQLERQCVKQIERRLAAGY